MPTILVWARSLHDRREDRSFDSVNGQRELRPGLASSVCVNCASSILGWCFGCEVRSGSDSQWQDCILRRGSQNPYLSTAKLNLSKRHRSELQASCRDERAATRNASVWLDGFGNIQTLPRQTATFHNIIGWQLVEVEMVGYGALMPVPSLFLDP